MPQCRIVQSKPYYYFRVYTKFKIPAKIYWWYSSRFGSEAQKKDAAKFVRVEKSIDKLSTIFGFFVDNEWIYDGTNLERTRDRLSPAEKTKFDFDTNAINWDMYLKCWCWGLMEYILKDQYERPDRDRKAVLFMGDRRPFSDFIFAMRNFALPNAQPHRRGTLSLPLSLSLSPFLSFSPSLLLSLSLPLSLSLLLSSLSLNLLDILSIFPSSPLL